MAGTFAMDTDMASLVLSHGQPATEGSFYFEDGWEYLRHDRSVSLVPEPSAVVLLLVGIGGVAARRPRSLGTAWPAGDGHSQSVVRP